MAINDMPFRRFCFAALVVSVIVVSFKPQILLSSRPTYVGTFFQILTLEFLSWCAWRVIFWPKLFSPLRHLPEPQGGDFWMGHFGRIRRERTGAPAADWINTIPNDGIMRYLSLFNAERILVTSPKAMSEVLNSKNYDYTKPRFLSEQLGRIIGFGVLLAEGEDHKFQRKHLLPAFAFRHIKDLYPVFWGKSRECALKMSEEIKETYGQDMAIEQEIQKSPLDKDQAIIECGQWAGRATLDIIGVAGMGKDFQAIQQPELPLNKTYATVFRPDSQAQVLNLVNAMLPATLANALPIQRNQEITDARETIRDVCRQLVREKKDKLEKKQLTDLDILSVALESGVFDEESLIDQLMTFLAAGHETTATAMTWATYLLCLHPNVQSRLREEVRAELPSIDEERDITSVDIDRLPYLNAVCNEVTRYYPPVPMTMREAIVNTTIQGFPIPKGTKIMIVPLAVNKSKDLWGPDADTFNPERWLPSADGYHKERAATGGASNNYAFMTYLHGPRSCIGQSFARAEFACMLAAWVGRMQFELLDERELDEANMEVRAGVTARPAKGLYVKARVVEGW